MCGKGYIVTHGVTMSDEQLLREKQDEVAELCALELQTRQLASMFDGLRTHFGRVNASMAGKLAISGFVRAAAGGGGYIGIGKLKELWTNSPLRM